MNKLKIALAILLLLCLAPMPYGYYQLVRVVAMILFAYLAYDAQQKKREGELILYIILAVLFQPFYKIALGRTIWNIVDVLVALYILYTVYNINKEKEN